MSFLPPHDPPISHGDYFTPKSNIAYFERRLEETRTQCAESSEECSLASHEGLAVLYRSKLAELRLGQEMTASVGQIPGEAQDVGFPERAVDQAQRPNLPLGWRRTSPALMA